MEKYLYSKTVKNRSNNIVFFDSETVETDTQHKINIIRDFRNGIIEHASNIIEHAAKYKQVYFVNEKNCFLEYTETETGDRTLYRLFEI